MNPEPQPMTPINLAESIVQLEAQVSHLQDGLKEIKSQIPSEDIRVYRVRLKHYVPEILDVEVIATDEEDAEAAVMQWLNEGELRDGWEKRIDLGDTEVEDVAETDLAPNPLDYGSTRAAEELLERFEKENE